MRLDRAKGLNSRQDAENAKKKKQDFGLRHFQTTAAVILLMLSSCPSVPGPIFRLVFRPNSGTILSMRRQSTAALKWVLFLGLVACPTWASEPAAVHHGHHCLWKVQSPHNTLYLLGSVHVLKESDYPLPAVIRTAFSNATVAVFETDIGQMEEPATQLKMLSQCRLPEGESLKQVLTAGTYQKLKAHAGEVGLPMSALDGLKPVMAAVSVEMVEMQKLGLDPQYGLDQHFFKLARRAGKKLVPLETVDFQIDLLTGLSREEGELMVKTTLEDIDNTRNLLTDMLTAWRTGDAAGLEKLLNQARVEAPTIFKRMVTDRTARWVPKLKELANGTQPGIVIVGAGHLVGPNGLVDLLQKAGLKVTQE